MGSGHKSKVNQMYTLYMGRDGMGDEVNVGLYETTEAVAEDVDFLDNHTYMLEDLQDSEGTWLGCSVEGFDFWVVGEDGEALMYVGRCPVTDQPTWEDLEDREQ